VYSKAQVEGIVEEALQKQRLQMEAMFAELLARREAGPSSTTAASLSLWLLLLF
jgi:hypothetical protein